MFTPLLPQTTCMKTEYNKYYKFSHHGEQNHNAQSMKKRVYCNPPEVTSHVLGHAHN